MTVGRTDFGIGDRSTEVPQDVRPEVDLVGGIELVAADADDQHRAAHPVEGGDEAAALVAHVMQIHRPTEQDVGSWIETTDDPLAVMSQPRLDVEHSPLADRRARLLEPVPAEFLFHAYR